MKRLLLVLTAVVLAALIPASALAAEGNESVTIVIGTASTQSGGQADIPVYLKNCAGVDSIQFDLNYDSAALTVVSVTPGDLFLAEYVVYNADEPGRIRIACADALGLKGDGTLLTVRFATRSDAGSALTATNGVMTRVDADYNQSKAYVSLEDGGVSIGTGAIPAALVTPWIPETPPPTPTPEPTPTVEPAPAELAQIEQSALPEASPTPSSDAVDPISYVVVAVLFVILITLIVVSVLKRRKLSAASQPDYPIRKDS